MNRLRGIPAKEHITLTILKIELQPEKLLAGAFFLFPEPFPSIEKFFA
jgi:hypothetical protein